MAETAMRRTLQLLAHLDDEPTVDEIAAWYFGVGKREAARAGAAAIGPPMSEAEALTMAAQLNGER